MPKHDPKQAFVALSTTREQIATDVNELIENEGWDVPKFTPDDERLDDEFCQSWVDCTAEAVYQTDKIVDRTYGYQRMTLADHLDIELEDDE